MRHVDPRGADTFGIFCATIVIYFLQRYQFFQGQTIDMERFNMKQIVLIVSFLVLTSGIAPAETMFVSDRMEITLRTGPGSDRKIISMLKSDEVVDVLETENGWSRVQLADGREGWAITRFLTSSRPSRINLKALKQEHDKLLTEITDLRQKNISLTDEKQQVGKELKQNKIRSTELSRSFETLKTESAGFIQLQLDYKNAMTALKQQTQRALELDTEVEKLKWNQNVRWFLSGAGVLLLGFIIGFSTKRQRRRSSLL